MPAARNNAELTRGFQSRAFLVSLLPAFFVPVALKKNAAANAIIHHERILVGNLSITKNVKTKKG